MRQTFVVIEDDVLVRQLLSAALVQDLNLVDVGGFARADECIRKLPALAPDLVVVDLYLGKEDDGLAIFTALKDRLPHTRWLLCTAADRASTVQRALKLGMHGVIMKKSPRTILIEAVQKILAGESYLCPESLRLAAANSDALNDTEREMLTYFGNGLSVGEIASLMGLTDKTIYNRSSLVRAKLGLDPMADLARYAIKFGLVPPP